MKCERTKNFVEEKIIKLYQLIRPVFDAARQGGYDLNKEIVESIISDFTPSLYSGLTIDDDDRQTLIRYATDALGIDINEYVGFRGLGLTLQANESQNNHDKYIWNKYLKHRNFLETNVFTNDLNVVESIDYETDQLIKNLPNAEDIQNISFRGLVIGHIQSGKTANFTHLISKLASLGYRFIVVLSGMTNALREQTQFRLDRELIGNNTTGSDLQFVEWFQEENGYKSLTKMTSTENNYSGDFEIPVETFDHLFETDDRTVIAVIKKLARDKDRHPGFGSVLGKLLLWITDSNNYRNVPIAVIDDEADQASIDNSNMEMDEDPSTINRAIRTLLSKFDKSVYFGYTATPFANVFINANSEFEGLPDLYPKDLIYALPKPSNYFGTEEFFNSENVSDYVRLTPDDEREMVNNSESDIPTEGLIEAFNNFFCAFIIKREYLDDSRTAMLIHTDHRNERHDVVKRKVDKCIEGLRENLEDEVFILDLVNTFINDSRSIIRKNSDSLDLVDISHEKILRQAESFFQELEIMVVNNRRDKLDYYNNELKTLICIGGNIMSRGLTIEGIVTSYYLRSSNNYDTLLQMGRWFGYRKGYYFLMRIHLTTMIYDQFEYMSLVESDLRSEISRYVEEGLGPLDFAPKVRAHLRMIPSSKMGMAQRLRSFSRMIFQTFHLSRDLRDIQHNENLVSELLHSHEDSLTQKKSKYVFSGIKIDELTDFIKSYKYTRKTDLSLNTDKLSNYIKKQTENNVFDSFDILVSSRSTPLNNAQIDFYCDQKLKWIPSKRNARKGTGWEFVDYQSVNIGVISSREDLPEVDDENFYKPLLILYSVDYINSDAFNRYYEERGEVDNYEKIEGLTQNVKGFALAFPKSPMDSDRNDYYQQIF